MSQHTADFLDLRVDILEQRVCFPVRDFSGVLRGLHGRAIQKDVDLRYKMYLHNKKHNSIVWLGESWVDVDKPVVIVEGPFDLAAVLPVYKNVVSPLFATPSVSKIKRLGDAIEVFTFLDKGVGGDKGRELFTSHLKDSVVTHIHPPESYKDPGEMSEVSLKTLFSQTFL